MLTSFKWTFNKLRSDPYVSCSHRARINATCARHATSYVFTCFSKSYGDPILKITGFLEDNINCHQKIRIKPEITFFWKLNSKVFSKKQKSFSKFWFPKIVSCNSVLLVFKKYTLISLIEPKLYIFFKKATKIFKFEYLQCLN